MLQINKSGGGKIINMIWGKEGLLNDCQQVVY